jgi:large exoprotein involved in heme utilization and adhesion
LVHVSGSANGLSSGILTSSETATSGAGGDITIGQPGSTSTLQLSEGGVLSALTRSDADGGDITVHAGRVELQTGGQLITSALSSGNAGEITVNASESISIDGANPNFVDLNNIANVGTGSGIVNEVETNDSIATAQIIQTGLFSLLFNPNVESSENIPYVSIGGTGDGSFDYYAFETLTPGSRGIFDIDATLDATGAEVDTEIFLFDSSGALLDFNDDSSITSGAGGSTSGLESYLSYTFGAPGRYVLGVSRFDSQVVSNAIEGEPLRAGDIYQLQVSLDNRNTNPNQGATSGFFARTEGSGGAGRMELNTPQLSVTNQAQVSVETESSGNAGGITIRPFEDERTLAIDLRDGGTISASTSGSGRGGNIELEAPQSITVEGRGTISAETSGTNTAGNLDINTQTLTIRGNTRLSTSTTSANEAAEGGDISVNANEINVSGRNSGLFAETEGAANAGNLTLRPYRRGETLDINFSNNGTISAETRGSGDGGRLLVSASEAVTISGDGTLSAQATRVGSAGQFTIDTNALTVEDGATVSASSNFSQGGSILLENLETLQVTNAEISASTETGIGGTLRVGAAQSVELSGRGGLFVEAEGGQAGSLFVNTPNLDLVNQARISVSSTADGRAGQLRLTARNVSLDNGDIFATTEQGRGGDITLRGINTLQLRNGSEISASTEDGTGGNLTVNVDQDPANLIALEGESRLSVEASGSGDAGNLTLNTRELRLSGRSDIIASTNSGSQGNVLLQGLDLLTVDSGRISASTRSGDAGSLIIAGANRIELSGGGGLFVQATRGGNAGDLTLNTNALRVRNGSAVSVSSTEDGDGGTLQVNARSIALNNEAQLLATTEAGAGGDIVLGNVRILQLGDRSVVSASTQNGAGGSVTVNQTGAAAQAIRLSDGSRLSAQATRRGSGGDVSLNTRELTLENNSEISASTNSGERGGDITLRNLNTLEVLNSEISASTATGQAGTLTVDARDSVLLSGEGGLRVQATDGGQAGSLNVQTGTLRIEDGAELSVSSRSGEAGNLFVDADTIRLNDGDIRAETGEGNGGNITLQGFTLLSLRNGSTISAEAFGRATGGNITINAPDSFIFAVPVENSDIIANADAGNGGVISITTRGIYGLQFRPELTPLSDITANSNTGESGTVTIDTLGIDPSRGLAELPTSVVDASQQVAQGCSARNGEAADLGEFVVTGRGGLPPNPLDPNQSNTGLTGLVTLDDASDSEDDAITMPIVDAPPQELPAIVEAEGWAIDAQGNVVLVSETAIAAQPATTDAVCLEQQTQQTATYIP